MWVRVPPSSPKRSTLVLYNTGSIQIPGALYLLTNKQKRNMGLGQLTPPEYLSCSGAQAIYNNTWGHLAPHKNVSYKGTVRFVMTTLSEYGSQPIIISYDFPNLEGPYIHSLLFNDVCEWNTERFEEGAVYEIKVTFRNYRFYYGKPSKVLNSECIN